ncbi:MAG: hypothetical protein ABI634_10240 [Acidobacteriota bacterium]
MKLQVRSTSVAIVASAMLAVAFASASVVAQKRTAADVAAKFSGTWVMKMATPAGGGPGRAGAAQPLYEVGFFSEFQGRRGGGGGGGAAGPGMGEGEKAGQAALAKIQQLGRTVTIKATTESVTFVDGNGERTYATNNQNVKTDVGGGAIVTTKSRWDGNTLKQQFIFGETSITQNWELSDDGNQINFKMQILNMSNQQPPKEAKLVFDRQTTPAAQ